VTAEAADGSSLFMVAAAPPIADAAIPTLIGWFGLGGQFAAAVPGEMAGFKLLYVYKGGKNAGIQAYADVVSPAPTQTPQQVAQIVIGIPKPKPIPAYTTAQLQSAAIETFNWTNLIRCAAYGCRDYPRGSRLLAWNWALYDAALAYAQWAALNIEACWPGTPERMAAAHKCLGAPELAQRVAKNWVVQGSAWVLKPGTRYAGSAWGENIHWQYGWAWPDTYNAPGKQACPRSMRPQPTALDPQCFVRSLYLSPPHRANIISREWLDLGVGIAQNGDAIVIVQVFGKPTRRP
jgi:uncharacterized protein YkwD